MAAGVIQAIQPHDPDTFEHGTVLAYEKASGTWKAGALLVLNGGYVEEAGSAPSTVKYVATEDGHNGGSDGAYTTQVLPITVDALWEITIKDAVAIALIGGNVGVVRDSSTGAWYGDNGDSGDQITIEAFIQTPQLGAIGDTYARGLVRFQSANIAGA